MKAMFKGLWERMNLTKNTTQKLISLLFALMFWIFVMDTENPEMTRVVSKVPINLVGIEQVAQRELELVEEDVYTVDIKVRGRRKEVLALTASDFKVSVDVYQAQKGKQNFPVAVKVLPADIMLETVSQTSIELNFDQLISASRPVVIDIVGSPPEPYFLDEPKLAKGLVDLNGPERLMNQVVHVKGQVDVSGVTASFVTEASLVPVDAQGQPIEGLVIGTQKIQVVLTVLEERRFPIELITENEVVPEVVLKGTELLPNVVTVIGETAVLDLISKINTEPVDLSRYNTATAIPLAFDLPKGVQLKPGESAALNLLIEPLQKRIMTIPVSQIVTMNLPENFQVQFDATAIDLMLSGPESLLSALEVTSVSITLDLLNLLGGRHSVPFIVTVPDGIEWVQAEGGVSQIDVVIEEPTSGE